MEKEMNQIVHYDYYEYGVDNMEYELVPWMIKNGIKYTGVSQFFNSESDIIAKEKAELKFKETENMIGYELWNNSNDTKIFCTA